MRVWPGCSLLEAPSDFYEQVTLVERDRLPDGAEQRRGVPQGRHLHGLLSTGSTALDHLLPGLLDQLVTAGANVLDNETRVYVRYGRHQLDRPGKLADPAPLVAYQPSRPRFWSPMSGDESAPSRM